MRRARILSLLTAATLVAPVASAHAALVSFTIDSQRSSLSLSGIVDFSFGGSYALEAQQPDSLDADYDGQIVADLLGPSVEIISAQFNALAAQSYLPSAQLDNYGYKLSLPTGTINGAIRNSQFEFSSDPLAAGDAFANAQANAIATQGTTDVDVIGSLNLFSMLPASDVSGTVNLSDDGLIQTMTIDLSMNYTGFVPGLMPADIDWTVAGTITATRALPEPATMSLLAIGAICVLRQARRGK